MKNTNVIHYYLELCKPRILTLVLLTTAFGFFLAAGGKIPSLLALFELMIGVACVCSGSAVLNHYLERDIDAKMERTRNRPLPLKLIPANHALLLGVYLVLLGVLFLWWRINLLTSFLSLLTSFLYILVYTPMKRISWINTTIGAIPGALPIVGGWAAARGELSIEAWILFAIMFIWQHPHFYSIAWMYKEDYARGGLKMLPVVHPDGRSTLIQIIGFLALLLFISTIPSYIGMSGKVYWWGAWILGFFFLQKGFELVFNPCHFAARNLLKASVLYLPLLFALMIVDITF
ncbi:MAG: heme o synthase [Candidatus Omnitrophica bacterium]|nr:heme o synthase [Candidatus Omnitrophota bacterium]